MNITMIVSSLVLLIAGCKAKSGSTTRVARPQQISSPANIVAPTSAQGAPTQDAVAWNPLSKGVVYQLSLEESAFTFCDNTGPQTVDLQTGRQSIGAFSCDRNNDAIKNGCDDGIDIIGPPDAPYDVVLGFKLHGHARDCDRDGDLVIVSTTGEIVLMNASTNKVAFVKAVVPDTVVIGSGWAAWNSQDKKLPLHLEKTSKLLQQAITRREE